MKRLLLLTGLLVLTLDVYSQSLVNNEVGGWLMFFNRTRFHEKWSLHTEIQDRFYDISAKEEQLLIRGGLNYHLNQKTWLTAGYGYIESYPPEDVVADKVVEHRIWQQVMHFHAIGRVAIEHRGRLEQRFVGDRYRDRIRYRLMATIPFNNRVMQPKTVFGAVYNELFLHQFESSPYDRNRFYTALGYQFTTATNLQAGYMAQNFAGKTKGYMQLGLTSNLYLLGK
ncbi:DUF2490 domain-containing protein [Litoribacter ruber]|uniref:DUF2490 domain-containing protein n=1 Tax=Litoribacter ruber TaxID=702568 RepID=A0AAP2CM50_9BACT|nr:MULTISPECIES: DUF2490 domain-containing protein [Litoribacter]MBS9524427.1 DUF2490 domain-containing protein [Litoribacter alkaliphilus]MBT0810419.1 DUF2490 domain-containing protein [Litoribacter ruber]